MTGGNHHCQGVRTGQGTEGTQAEARDRGILKALRKQMEPDGTRGCRGWYCLAAQSLDQLLQDPREGAKK